MDKRFWIIMGFSAASFTVGAVTAHVHTKKVLDEYYSKQIDVEVAAALALQADDVIGGVKKAKRDALQNISETADQIAEKLVEAPEALRQADGRISYHKVPRAAPAADGAHEWTGGTNGHGEISSPVRGEEEAEFEVVEEDEDGMPRDLEQANLRVIRAENEARKAQGLPYVIPQEEVYEDFDDYRTMTLTYYAGDMVLANDVGIETLDIEEFIGEANLQMFGYLSEPNIVCIRNDKRKLLMEVSLNVGHFSVEVEGQKGR